MKFETNERDVRAELIEIMAAHEIGRLAIARELNLPHGVFGAWLESKACAPSIEAAVRQFIDDRDLIWAVLAGDAEIANVHRRQLAQALVRNVKVLAGELAAASGREDMGEHVAMYLNDLRRLIDLLSSDENVAARRLVAAARSLLAPGDKLVISRGGNKAGARAEGSK